MNDQAEMLRKITGKTHDEAFNENAIKKRARVITVTSGKGGVGKTSIAVNLAIHLSRKGLKVVILDFDFGLSNVDVLFGIVPNHTLLDVVHGEKNMFEVLTNGPDNIKFLSGGSGVEELIRLDRRQTRKLIANINILDKLFDVILIDTGAGLLRNVMNFVMAADEVVLITTPEPTAITDAYALIKMVSRRDRKKQINIVVNKADTLKEAENVANKLCLVSEKFLSLRLSKLGYILYDDNVTKSVKLQKPLSLYNSKSTASKSIGEIADRMFSDSNGMDNQGAKGFISKLLSFFSA
ncbi:MAG: MinD/ParA family protein [Clostridiaceae bacterium]|nr:MinD/ParA family protein [Clostridiaceae bacterium]